jgi:hypothetical protein
MFWRLRCYSLCVLLRFLTPVVVLKLALRYLDTVHA